MKSPFEAIQRCKSCGAVYKPLTETSRDANNDLVITRRCACGDVRTTTFKRVGWQK